MVETLFQAYSPLLFWVGMGLLVLRILPDKLPRILARSLYWVGVPWQIFALARYTDLSGGVGLVPVITVSTLSFGILLAWLTSSLLNRVALVSPVEATGVMVTESVLPKVDGASAVEIAVSESASGLSDAATNPTRWQKLRQIWPNYNRNQQGSFILAGMLGNTGFVGLGLLPDLISAENMRWAVFFSLTQNLIGTYTLGVMVASHFGGTTPQSRWWALVRNVILVPSLWAFCLGYFTRAWPTPAWADVLAQGWYYWVIPASFLLMGMRLGQMQGWKSIQRAVPPVLLKLLLLPVFVAVGTTFLGFTGEPRLALVMMSGMPCAFAGLILAEEYELDRDLAASTIALSTFGLLVMIPIWLVVLA
ncbi:AEC family transporter [filamentous cyanobacterium LEGE 11480]|uniref:AEC family transporter n=1 Tax=Romeriopsis navalis LEGE 11480 TaxID=2777977 RepID=A0A928VQZ1_9CYAN|nr:AEC family transporter [Romeriopsis navalis]MBE9030922.1 AEC family transporter [Romeriopsis navalis LEGE 11480]